MIISTYSDELLHMYIIAHSCGGRHLSVGGQRGLTGLKQIKVSKPYMGFTKLDHLNLLIYEKNSSCVTLGKLTTDEAMVNFICYSSTKHY